MVIRNHKDDDKFKIRSCICSTSYKNIQNINYGNNDQDLLSLNSQSQLTNCSSLHSLSNNCLRLYHQNINSTDELIFLISSFRRVLYVVCFLLGNYPASGVYMPTFQNTLSVPTS